MIFTYMHVKSISSSSKVEGAVAVTLAIMGSNGCEFIHMKLVLGDMTREKCLSSDFSSIVSIISNLILSIIKENILLNTL